MPQTAAGSNIVVILPPAGEDRAGLVQVQEPGLREALTPEASVERLDVGVVRRLARAAEVQPDPVPVGPVVERFRGELPPIVDRDALRQLAPTLSHFAQDAADVFCVKGGPGHQRPTLPRGDVHHDRAAVCQYVVHEVHRPALVGSRDERPHLSNSRALAPLCPPPLEPQPLFRVQPVDELVIDTPVRLPAPAPPARTRSACPRPAHSPAAPRPGPPIRRPRRRRVRPPPPGAGRPRRPGESPPAPSGSGSLALFSQLCIIHI